MTWTSTADRIVMAGKIRFIEQEGSLRRFTCRWDASQVEFPASDLSRDALGQVSLSSKPTCEENNHIWYVHKDHATYAGT
jgi:hypothetical protein